MVSTINPTAQHYIDKIREVCERVKPLVVIHCITYNHEPYLRDALEGFIMQKTNFPFVAIIHEDVSTDGTAHILREYAEMYPDTILPIFEKENQYSKGTLTKIMNEACKATGAKYIAMCEGDDYWTDPLKLQKQVDFLEKNSDYSLCFHRVEIRHEGTKNVVSIKEDVLNKDYTAQEIFEQWIIPTCSAVFRLDCYNYLPSHKDFIVGDNVLWATCLTRGKIRGIEDCMGVYRRVDTGWIALQNKSRSIKYNTKKRWIKHYKAMIDCFPDIDRAVFEDKMIKHMADISVIDISTLNKNSLNNFRLFYRGFGGRYIKQLAKSFYSTLKYRIKVDFKK